MLSHQIELLRKIEVRSITFRCNGDQLVLIHIVNELKFRYYETIIWPITNTDTIKSEVKHTVRLIKESEFDIDTEIANRYQYKRGHYYCDNRYDKVAVDNLYAKWGLSSSDNSANIAVIEYEKNVAGYFIFKIIKLLKKYLGFSHGRLSSIAINGKLRGKGLGKNLFNVILNIIKNLGAEYIDSGYVLQKTICRLNYIH